MSNNWGPHYIVPSDVLKSYSGSVLLREGLDDELLEKELKEFGFKGRIDSISNPWYYRKKGDETWIMIGESHDRQRFFPVRWDTTGIENGQYEIKGLMHVYLSDEESNNIGKAIARENTVEVIIEN